MLIPVILVGAVGASGPDRDAPVRDSAVTTLAAVEPSPRDRAGPNVIAVKMAPRDFKIAASAASAPPPAVVVNSPGSLGIPAMALAAYRNAEGMMAKSFPGCGVSWNLLAGIGRIESQHANGGATDARGNPRQPIYGPALDGTLPGNEVIVQSRTSDRVVYARAMGPMQFLPGTWARYKSDGDGDGKAEVQNLFDASLGAARYLCSGGLNLRDQSQVMTAILRYNNSVAYARNVLSWAAGYATGVMPVDLPPITGSVPVLGDSDAFGPGAARDASGLPADDPLALMPLMGRTGPPPGNVPGFAPGQALGPLPGPAPAPVATAPEPVPPPWAPPWMQPPPKPRCVVFCLTEDAPTGTAPGPGAVGPAPAAPASVPAPAAPLPAPAADPAAPPAPDPAAPPAAGPAADPAAGPAPGPAPGPAA